MNEDVEADLVRLGITPAELEARGFCRYEEAAELEVVQVDPDGREYFLAPPAAVAWRAMRMAAADEGVNLVLVSAFRSMARQAQIIQRKLDLGIDIAEILKTNAAPGYSEHHTGRAVDIANVNGPILDIAFEQTGAFAWLQKNASQFSFYLSFPRSNRWGYQYEPWHWCFNSPGMTSEAKAIRPSGRLR